MLFWIQIILAFIAGVVWNKFWTTLIGSGHTLVMIKKTQIECLKMMHHVDIACGLALDMKYKYLDKAGFTDRNLNGERKLDEHVLNGMRTTMVSTLYLSIPTAFSGIAKYSDWDSAMEFLKENK